VQGGDLAGVRLESIQGPVDQVGSALTLVARFRPNGGGGAVWIR
jgi:hypothetical protein